MSRVDIKHVFKDYGKTRALDDISLSIAEGEFFALLGPSGGGKTTLLRSIAGFVEPDSGSVEIDGRPMRDVSINQREIGMMFQNYALFPHLSVADNIGFGLSVRHRPKDEIKRRTEALLALVRMQGFGERRPSELSGGQQQRVALARALATQPRVVLLDEPLGALDKKLRDEMQIELKKIQREVGITTIFVTHDQDEALIMSDRVAIINGGKVVQVGTPRQVYERPETRFAASFLGESNFFPGEVSAQVNGVTHVTLEDGQIIYSSHGSNRRTGEKVLAAVRPERLYASAIGSTQNLANRITGRIAHEIYTGNSITYKIEMGDQQLNLFLQNNNGCALYPGQQAVIEWNPADTLLVN
ncbi:spermidine/putrescine ABC transporter ATP-binding protein [Caballeronia mineralivorans PML1(12)]|uniref:Spermidine/putrescine ABC transporter ATP-binding protein n=1 Tax=Caballeronia mineralivorans PML1(12) TaxID=908627 RepID=A0A0J1D0K2_9BURK|nr:ABC transporter ATP-binding protein [Caballeronia mineralivorans]KLU26176.1 spermidine/putrescine ABC transporter ATP-binding protein [Caballeronia mineralivorans PML1(12)]